MTFNKKRLVKQDQVNVVAAIKNLCDQALLAQRQGNADEFARKAQSISQINLALKKFVHDLNKDDPTEIPATVEQAYR